MKKSSAIVLLAVIALSSPAYADDGYDAAGFEPPQFNVGSLDGQSNWRVVDVGGAADDALVQQRDACSGAQAVELKNVGRRVVARYVSVQRNTFYFDAMVKLPGAEAIQTNAMILLRGRNAENKPATMIVVAFNGSGAVNDVPAGKANHYQSGQWTRVTIRVDVDAQSWTLFLDGLRAGDALTFVKGAALRQIDTFDFSWHSRPDVGGDGVLVDNLTIGSEDPLAKVE